MHHRYQRELVEQGYIYIACPPLYKVTPKGSKKETYLYDQAQLDTYFTTHNQENTLMQRFKGLGEMMPTQLWDTTMNPDTRILKQVNFSIGMCHICIVLLLRSVHLMSPEVWYKF